MATATDLDDLTFDPNRKLAVVGTNPIKPMVSTR